MEPGALNAVGAWFRALDTNRYLYLLRNDPKNPGSWGLPGGKADPGETLIQALERECQEEIGQWPDVIKLVPLEMFTSNNDHFCYHTFFCPVAEEFQPRLNDEHLGYAWVDAQAWPRPMHPGLWATVNVEEILHKIQTLTDVIRCRNS